MEYCICYSIIPIHYFFHAFSAYSKVGRVNLVLRHSIFIFLPHFSDIKTLIDVRNPTPRFFLLPERENTKEVCRDRSVWRSVLADNSAS